MELQWYDIRQLDAEEEARVTAMMDGVRRRRVADIAGEDDRKRTVAGELLARRMLASKLGCGEADVPLAWDELGKPTVTAEGTYVSVSHSGAWAVCVTADAPVGVDVEVVRSAQEKFMRRVCSQQEMACIRPGDDGDCRRFWEIWTAKEALFKLTGKGPLLSLSRLALPEGVALSVTVRGTESLSIAQMAELFDRLYVPAESDAAAVKAALPEGYDPETRVVLTTAEAAASGSYMIVK